MQAQAAVTLVVLDLIKQQLMLILTASLILAAMSLYM
jgi:hypothetical protein